LIEGFKPIQVFDPFHAFVRFVWQDRSSDRPWESLSSTAPGLPCQVNRERRRLATIQGFLGSVDDDIVNFSMDRARDCAWDLAKRLAALEGPAQEREIRRQDAGILDLARRVRYPGFLLGTATKIVRLGERGSVREIIEVLE
jgi:hypothetical protein